MKLVKKKLFIFFMLFSFNLHAQKIISVGVCSDLWVLALMNPDEITALTRGADNLTISPYTKIAKPIYKHHGTFEEVLSLKANMIVGDDYTDPFLENNIKKLGLPYYHISLSNKLADWQNVTKDLGKQFGKIDKANQIIKSQKNLWKDILKNKEILEHRHIGMVANFRPAGYSAGTESLTDDVISYIGGTSLSQRKGHKYNVQIPLETLLLEKPDRLLFDLKYEDNGSISQKILRHPALQKMDGLPKNYFPLRYGFCLSPESLKGVIKLQKEILQER